MCFSKAHLWFQRLVSALAGVETSASITQLANPAVKQVLLTSFVGDT